MYSQKSFPNFASIPLTDPKPQKPNSSLPRAEFRRVKTKSPDQARLLDIACGIMCSSEERLKALETLLIVSVRQPEKQEYIFERVAWYLVATDFDQDYTHVICQRFLEECPAPPAHELVLDNICKAFSLAQRYGTRNIERAQSVPGLKYDRWLFNEKHDLNAGRVLAALLGNLHGAHALDLLKQILRTSSDITTLMLAIEAVAILPLDQGLIATLTHRIERRTLPENLSDRAIQIHDEKLGFNTNDSERERSSVDLNESAGGIATFESTTEHYQQNFPTYPVSDKDQIIAFNARKHLLDLREGKIARGIKLLRECHPQDGVRLGFDILERKTLSPLVCGAIIGHLASLALSSEVNRADILVGFVKLYKVREELSAFIVPALALKIMPKIEEVKYHDILLEEVQKCMMLNLFGDYLPNNVDIDSSSFRDLCRILAGLKGLSSAQYCLSLLVQRQEKDSVFLVLDAIRARRRDPAMREAVRISKLLEESKGGKVSADLKQIFGFVYKRRSFLRRVYEKIWHGVSYSAF